VLSVNSLARSNALSTMLLLIQFWSFIAILDVVFSDGKIQSFDHQLIEVTEELVPDPVVDKLVNAVMSPDRDMLEEVVGELREYVCQ